jgi:hypothetical protein
MPTTSPSLWIVVIDTHAELVRGACLAFGHIRLPAHAARTACSCRGLHQIFATPLKQERIGWMSDRFFHHRSGPCNSHNRISHSKPHPARLWRLFRVDQIIRLMNCRPNCGERCIARPYQVRFRGCLSESLRARVGAVRRQRTLQTIR